MSYIILNVLDKRNRGNYKLYEDNLYYAYDTTDLTIEACYGSDILLLMETGREVLNYDEQGYNRPMTSMCLAHPDLGICLRNNIMHIACCNNLWIVSGVETANYIMINMDGFVMECNMNEQVIVSAKSCDVINYHNMMLHRKLLGSYKDGQAGITIMKYYL